MAAFSLSTLTGSVVGKLRWLKAVVLGVCIRITLGTCKNTSAGPDTQRSCFRKGWGGTHKFAFLTSSYVAIMLLVHGLHLDHKDIRGLVYQEAFRKTVLGVLQWLEDEGPNTRLLFCSAILSVSPLMIARGLSQSQHGVLTGQQAKRKEECRSQNRRKGLSPHAHSSWNP